jgi:REP element-mobilizing transposase RayT
MPGCPRKHVFDPTTVGVYHCYNRCVRRAFLCGVDGQSQEDRSHRKEWVRHRLEALASVFAIDVATHSAMDNHLHVVLRNRPDVAVSWSDEEVVQRWLQLDAKKLELQPVNEVELRESLRNPDIVATYRARLSHISEFMRMLDESIARAANREDGVTGHFWEERYKCQRLLDEASLLACSVYVDLNPIRAMLAETPEDSVYTSAHDRIHDLKMSAGIQRAQNLAAGHEASSTGKRAERSGWLAPIDERGDGYNGVAARRRASNLGILPITLERYLEFLDWTGRQLRTDKSGSIPEHLAPILQRLGIRVDAWIETVACFGRSFGHVVGAAEAVMKHAFAHGRQRWGGTRNCQHAFG